MSKSEDMNDAYMKAVLPSNGIRMVAFIVPVASGGRVKTGAVLWHNSTRDDELAGSFVVETGKMAQIGHYFLDDHCAFAFRLGVAQVSLVYAEFFLDAVFDY